MNPKNPANSIPIAGTLRYKQNQPTGQSGQGQSSNSISSQKTSTTQQVTSIVFQWGFIQDPPGSFSATYVADATNQSIPGVYTPPTQVTKKDLINA